MEEAPPPSGAQCEIGHGNQRAVIVEVGGGLRSYQVGGFDVLDGYRVDQMCTGGRGAPLIPWPNRLRDGRYDFAGQSHQLALTEPSKRNAIHGLLRWQRWSFTDHGADRVTVEAVLHPQPGYPFTLAASIEYALTAGGLRVAITGRNLGSEPLPFGAGQHPYIRVDDGGIDSARVESPARTRLLVDRRQVPTGERAPVAGKHDLRRPRRIGRRMLDAPYTDLERDADGLARVVMSGRRRRVTVWMDAGFPHLMLFTGDTLAPDQRRRGLAVEPMTCPPNAFQTGEDVKPLGPGEAFTATWGITVEAIQPSE
ncbi:MAG TPA: aldose 1-epimerase family protein [Candidatus Dormibacteraeota bacterium]